MASLQRIRWHALQCKFTHSPAAYILLFGLTDRHPTLIRYVMHNAVYVSQGARILPFWYHSSEAGCLCLIAMLDVRASQTS